MLIRLLLRALMLLAAGLAANTLRIPPAAAAAAAAAPAKAETVRMDHISVVAIGEGPAVVLIPGLASPRAAWDGVAPGLAAGRRVYLVQVNGFGGDDPRGNLKPGVLPGIVADLHALIAREHIAGAAVVGHSMGGLVGLMLAKAHPADVGKLMIVDSLPFFGVLMAPGGEASVAMVEPFAAQMRDKVAAAYGKPADPAAIEAQTAGMALDPAARIKLRAWAAAADPRVTAQAMYEDLTSDLRPDLASIRTPITLVHPWSAAQGGKDKVDAFYRRQYAGIPQLTEVSVADAAHFVMLDQPAKFDAILKAFLTGAK